MANLHRLGTTLREIRKNQHLSQEDIALELEISQEAYRKIESGQTELTVKRLNQICNILGVDMIHILLPDERGKSEIKEIKDQATGIINNGGTVNNNDKSIESRMSRLEECIQVLIKLLENKSISGS